MSGVEDLKANEAEKSMPSPQQEVCVYTLVHSVDSDTALSDLTLTLKLHLCCRRLL